MTILAVIVLILLIAAVVLLGLAAFVTNPTHPPRFNWGWAGLFCWALGILLTQIVPLAEGTRSLRH